MQLAAARYGISIAEARQITAALRPNPVLTTSADHLDVLGTGYNATNNAGPNEYALRTDFVIERGGKRAARMNLATAERSFAQLGFQDAMRRLLFDVASASLKTRVSFSAGSSSRHSQPVVPSTSRVTG